MGRRVRGSSSRHAAEMRVRKARLRAAGVRPSELFAGVSAAVRQATPAGWGAKKVVPTWAGQSGRCRSCGESDSKIVAMLTRQLPDEKVLLFTFAMVCHGCINDPDKMRELGDRAFAVQ
jgi:hypothetical protein